MQRKNWLGTAVTAAFLFAGCIAGYVRPVAADEHYGAKYFTNLPLTTQDGKTVHFYDDVLKGKIVAIQSHLHQLRVFMPAGNGASGPGTENIGKPRRQRYFLLLDYDRSGAGHAPGAEELCGKISCWTGLDFSYRQKKRTLISSAGSWDYGRRPHKTKDGAHASSAHRQ